MRGLIGLQFVLFLTIMEFGGTEGELLKKARKIKEFGHGVPIYGIHQIKSQLYVCRDSTPYLEVYDALYGNALLRNWTFPGMQGPYDMVGMGKGFYNMFITDWFDASNISVTSGKVEGTLWKFSIGEPFTVVGLAEINNGNAVLVTCSATKKIKQFTKDGVLTGEVPLPDIVQPRHSIKLLGGGYAVCHGYGLDQLHRVCKVDSQGQIQVCHGGHNGSSVDQLDVPARILELPGEGILVADRENKRVVLLDSDTLKFKQEVVTAKNGLEGPARMYYEYPILYVADNRQEDGLSVSGKIIMFRIKT